MERKPIVLIVTSFDEPKKLSDIVKNSLQAKGKYNAVVISDEQYGKAFVFNKFAGYVNNKLDFQKKLVKDSIAKSKMENKKKTPSKRILKIENAIKRYRPEFILTLTPYARYVVVEAEQKLNFETPICHMLTTFTAGKRFFDEHTDKFVVENVDIKKALIESGVDKKDIVVAGLPFDIEKITPFEITKIKQDCGLPRTKTIFVSVDNKKEREEIVSLLADQGDIINVVVYVTDDKEIANLKANIIVEDGMTIVYVTKEESFDEYLAISDYAVSSYAVSTIYKCLHLGIPVITYGQGVQTSKELDYIESNNLIQRASDTIDIVKCVYELMQTDKDEIISKSCLSWVENISKESFAQYLNDISFVDED